MSFREKQKLRKGSRHKYPGPFFYPIIQHMYHKMIDKHHFTDYTNIKFLKDVHMPYERTRRIEQRFQQTIDLLKQKHLNANQLAKELDVSRPTAQRIIGELKARGYNIRSVHDAQGWSYELIEKY